MSEFAAKTHSAPSSQSREHAASDKAAQLQDQRTDASATRQLVDRRTSGGMPQQLAQGVESLSGVSLKDVRVHYNSPKPAQVQAYAYTQGKDIHVASGQEHHLPHEAWHVAQQAQGRVKPTTQTNGLPVNDDKGLEAEATAMGNKAAQMTSFTPATSPSMAQGQAIVQYALPPNGLADTHGYYNPQGKSKTVAYSGDYRPVDFSTAFKMKMVENEWHGHFNQTTDMWFVQTSGSSGVVLPTNAIQIDHKVPWKNISAELNKKPTTVYNKDQLTELYNNGYITSDGNSYTLYAARLYYHDVENLTPMAGSENAAKSANSADDTNIALDAAISHKAARSAGIHHEMMTAAQQAFREWGKNPDDLTEIMQQIDNADAAMSTSAENLFGM